MYKRKLHELNLLDDFLMFTLVNHPKYGEKFSRDILKIILGKEFKKLKIIPQKVYYGSDTDKHGARLDVYLEEEEDGDTATVCDVEPNIDDSKEHIKSLPRKMRFYHSKIDAGVLETGADYKSLKNVVVIMITPYDPFGENLMVYTIKNGCLEKPDMPYEDGARTIYLYTRGEEGNPREELRELLRYLEKTEKSNAQNEMLQEIHTMVEDVKKDAEVSAGYMRMMRSQEELLWKEKQRADAAESRADTAEAELDATKKKVDAAESRADTAEAELDATKKKVDVAESRADAAEAELKKLRQEIERLKAEKETLEKM